MKFEGLDRNDCSSMIFRPLNRVITENSLPYIGI